MTTAPEFQSDPKRDATASIRGYVYQAYQSILAWIQLKDNEILILEGAEDFDIHCGLNVTTTQVKDVSRTLTLRTPAVVDSLNNYWAHCQRNPEYEIFLRFLTSAEAGQEKGAPFGSGRNGLDCWNSIVSGGTDIDPIRAFLNTLELESGLASFIATATDDELRAKLICRIKWDLGNRSREALQYILEDKLKNHGAKFGINPHYSCQALSHLLKTVADLLSTAGPKELRFSDFLTCFSQATTVTIPRGEIEAMSSSGNLQQLVGLLDMAELMRLSSGPSPIGIPLPIVDGGIPRATLVSNLAKLLRDQRAIFLHGSSGLGKTNLATLISNEIGGNWGWATFRSMQPEQIKGILARAAFEMNASRLTSLLVLDDVEFSQVLCFEREFIALVFSAINSNGMVVITGPTRPPLQLLPKLWKDETCEVAVPYFDESEVAEMVRGHGLSDDGRVSEWARTIWLTTSGHPQLVHARVRNLSVKGWPAIQLSDLTKPEDVERVRSEARIRLVNEFPTENTRALAYRLSLINGAFSREIAIAVAMTPPPINAPGEAFESLIGPWVEREGADRYRISPLLTGAANKVLPAAEIKAVHGEIALNIIGRKTIDQFDIGTAFFHAFMARHIEVLLTIANSIITSDSEHTHLLYDAMSWFAVVGLAAGQRIIPDNPTIDLMLRLAQYKVIAASPESGKAIAVIERIEETLNEINEPEIKQSSEALAYGMILNSYEIEIPSSMVVRMLSRMMDVADENVLVKEISDSFSGGQGNLPRLGDNKPAQVLFSYQGARLSGLDDLFELVTSLDSLPPQKRDQLLRVCESDIDFASLLINRAWWKEVKDGTLEVSKALQVLDHTATKSREWKAPALTKACLVATSVMKDEYVHSTEDALEILDAGDKEFPDEASLVNQRAKVLFHANSDLEAIEVAKRALKLKGLSNVEFVFCCRNAGIAAAKLNNWAEAESFFRVGAAKAEHSAMQEGMEIGLKADAAFALWKQMDYANSLLMFADVLDSLANIPLTDDIRIRYLHATVRHCISWIHFEARGQFDADIVEPLPGMCSNQEPHEGIKDHRIVDMSAAWQLLAATERVLAIDGGIGTRAQTVTGDRNSLVMRGYERTLALDALFKSRNFDSLVPILIEMIEGMHHSRLLNEHQADVWAIGEIPKLPHDYWQQSEGGDLICSYLLVASVICTADEQISFLPTERWRNDLKNAGALSAGVSQFLDVLNGRFPDDSLYQQAASAILKLRNGPPALPELWKCSFRLLNALMNQRPLVEGALERVLIRRWFYATNSQRFAFSTPSLACAEIERCWLDKSLSGFSKVAVALDTARRYLNVRISADVVAMLKKIGNQ